VSRLPEDTINVPSSSLAKTGVQFTECRKLGSRTQFSIGCAFSQSDLWVCKISMNWSSWRSGKFDE